MSQSDKKINVDEAVKNFLKSAYDSNVPNKLLKSIDSKVFETFTSFESKISKRIWHYFSIILFLILTCFIIILLFLSLFLIVYNLDLTPISIVTSFDYLIYNYINFFGDNPHTQKCLINVENNIPHYIDLFRKPHACNFCVAINSAKRLKRVSVTKFIEYVENKQPIVITDAMVNWSAPSTFSYEYFKTLYQETIPEEEFESYELSCQFFPYKTEFKSLKDVFTMSEDRAKMKNFTKPWYVGWSNCWPSATTQLRQHYSRPYFLPKFSESSRIDWIFMGSVGYGAHMHVDDVSHPSWQAQIKGTKIWTLKPPLECLSICNSFDIRVKPGEIIVLDTNVWYHSTMIVGTQMSITIGSEFD